MLAKITSKNQLTLPKAAVQQIGRPDYFDVSIEGGRIVLTPVQIQLQPITLPPLQARPADAVRNRLSALGITEQDVTDALAWSHKAHA